MTQDDTNKTRRASEPSRVGSPTLEAIAAPLRELFGDALEDATMGLDMPTIRVHRSRLPDVCRVLRDDRNLRFDMLTDLTCVDYLTRDPRFDVVCHLFSVPRKARVRVKAGIPEDPAECPTLTEVYLNANWAEREAFDMFGVVFPGHPNLERILNPEDWEHFPLRRDFPLQGPGMVRLYDRVTDIF